MFCALRLVFVFTECVESRLHILRSRTHFRRNRRRRVPFSSLALPDSFWARAAPRASGPVFIFCAPRHIFGGTEGALESRFHVLHSRTRLGLYRGCGALFSYFELSKSFGADRGRRVPFSSFALLDTFLAVSRARRPVFMFCAPEPVLDGTEGVWSSFHNLRSRTLWAVPRESSPVYMFCVLILVSGGTEGV
jgi:hypothetical protein